MIRNIALFAVICALFALASQVQGVPDREGAGKAADDATYIGAKKCRKCHNKQHKTWKKMRHANAWETLPEKYRDGKEKDESGRVCISCHVTGYGQAERGGFVDAEKSKHLLGVQCEMCHGPGSKHKAAGQKLMDDLKKKARTSKTFEEGEESLIIRKPQSCTNCHNPHVNHSKYKEQG